MKIIYGDLFDTKLLLNADAIGITTNCVIKQDGTAVMGAGVAKLAANKWPDLPRLLAKCLRETGKNSCHYLGAHPVVRSPVLSTIDVFSFPTKFHWRNNSDLNLIKRSAREAAELATKHGWKNVILAPPGVGQGNLPWAKVKEVLDVLDDRFTVIFLAR